MIAKNGNVFTVLTFYESAEALSVFKLDRTLQTPECDKGRYHTR